jgi:hypothetical protein
MKTPNFETIYPKEACKALRDMHTAITACDLWDWLREFKPHSNEGFMFSTHPNLSRINEKVTYEHSGASYGMTMRIMESIAKLGWEEHLRQHRRQTYIQQLKIWVKTINLRPCYCRAAYGYRSGWCSMAGGGVPGCEH